MSTLVRTALLAAASAVVGFVLALALDVPAHDALVLVGDTLLAAIPVALLGIAVMAQRRRPTLRAQAVLAALVVLVIVVAGSVAAAAAMFISAHDFRAFIVTVAVSAGVALAVALHLADRVGADARALEVALAADLDGAPNIQYATLDASVRSEVPDDDLLEGVQLAELHDLARRLRNASTALGEARRREQAVEHSRRELVAWISHDLRSPLASIRALSEALEDDIVTDPDDVQRYLRSIRRETDRLSTLVDDLFELSRVQAGAVSTSAAVPVPISEVIDDAITGVRGLAVTKGVAVECRGAVGDELAVPGQDVVRIVRNLLDNAVRHTPEGGTVVLSVASDDDGVRLHVADECGGIPPAELDRVFDVAFRGDAARARTDRGGGGLGLAIARGLAEAHAGELDVRNVGAGCRFELRMPRRAS